MLSTPSDHLLIIPTQTCALSPPSSQLHTLCTRPARNLLSSSLRQTIPPASLPTRCARTALDTTLPSMTVPCSIPSLSSSSSPAPSLFLHSYSVSRTFSCVLPAP